MILKLKIFIYDLIFFKLRIWLIILCNKKLRNQFLNPKEIPILIINFNQLYYLRKLVDFLILRKFKNIIIIDNASTYPPLLEYYKDLPKNVNVELLDQNYGHMVFNKNKMLQVKYGQGFYVLTDADIVPNNSLPENFLKRLLLILLKEFSSVNKVGFALDIENIPDYYIKKSNVIKFEKQFWTNRYDCNLEAYRNYIDTTFAVYKPLFFQEFKKREFCDGIRIAGNYTAFHGGWDIDYQNMTDEQKYYQKTAGRSSSWKLNEDGEFNEFVKEEYN